MSWKAERNNGKPTQEEQEKHARKKGISMEKAKDLQAQLLALLEETEQKAYDSKLALERFREAKTEKEDSKLRLHKKLLALDNNRVRALIRAYNGITDFIELSEVKPI